MKISKEFSNHAKVYDDYNSIQLQVAQKLLENVSTNTLDSVIDLGCGSGVVYNLIGKETKEFYAIDFAQGMLDVHPKADNITCMLADFNKKELFNLFKDTSIDRLISSSALQWSEDIDKTFSYISSLNTKVSLAIFTCNTFKTVNEIASLPKFLRCNEVIEKSAKKYFDAEYTLVEYKLHFDSNEAMFRYIKQSGVSASRRLLSYKQTKALIKNYPHNYLEFEVLFITES